MIIGYARTSTIDQVAGLEAQLEQLKNAGCSKIFSEQVSSVAEREQLDRALGRVEEGDVFVVTKLDRLARSIKDLVEIKDKLTSTGVTLRILDLSIDTSTPTGKLLVNLLGSIAEFEREIMLERQREGIAKAKREGKYKGRPPKIIGMRKDIAELHKNGMPKTRIAKALNIGIASVYRALQ